MHSVHMIYSMTLHKMRDTSRVEHEATLKFIEEVHNCLAVWDISRAVYQDGKVEKTDPCSTDYPLTPTPQTTLQTIPQTTLLSTLRTTPMDYPQ